jgi:hypothetical protein
VYARPGHDAASVERTGTSRHARAFADPSLQDSAMIDQKNPNSTEARAGATPHVARYVLMISLLLIVAAFATLMIVYR